MGVKQVSSSTQYRDKVANAPVLDARGRPLQDLRVSVIDRCNFRCNYCLPKEVFGLDHPFLPASAWLDFDAIVRVVRVLVLHLGVSKVHLTGGEPLLRPDLPRLVERLRVIPGLQELVLTTNGSRVTPEMAQTLVRAGLTRATVSLDALDDATFQRMNGVGFPVRRVLEAMDLLEAAGLPPVQINAVIRRGYNEHAIVPLAGHFRGTGRVVRFIEFMDVGTVNGWRPEAVVTAREIRDTIARHWPLEPVRPVRPSETARRYRYQDGQGEIGIIASVTEPFCGGCTRLRLTADGRLYTCLFQSTGHDLRPLLAAPDDEPLQTFVTALWQQRTDQYSVERARLFPHRAAPPEMFRLGG